MIHEVPGVRRKEVLRKKLGSDVGEEQEQPRKKGNQNEENKQEHWSGQQINRLTFITEQSTRTRASREGEVERLTFNHGQVVEMMRWNVLQVWRNLLEGATAIALPITLPLIKIKYTDNRKGGGDRTGWR